MNKFNLIKTIQLVVFILITIAIFLWVILGLSFVFLYYDFYSFTGIRRENAELDNAIYSDALTGIANRYSVDLYLGQFQNQPLPYDIGCVTIEMSNLVSINKEHGHEAGDGAIQDFSEIMRRASSGTALSEGTGEISSWRYSGTVRRRSSADFSIYAAILSTESGPTEMDGQSYQFSHAGWYMTVKSGSVGRTAIPAAASWWTFSTAPGGYRLSSDGRYLRLNGSQWAMTADVSAASVFDVSFYDPYWLIQEKRQGHTSDTVISSKTQHTVSMMLSWCYPMKQRMLTISGHYVVVVTDQYGAQGALMADTSRNYSNRLAVAAYDPAELHTIWTFEKAAGASLHYAYTYVDGVPKYLNLSNGTLSLSDSPFTVYISAWNGAIRMVNADGYAVNLGGNSVKGGKGFGAYKGDVAPNEWLVLIPDSGLKIRYVYAANEEAGGTAEEFPAEKNVILHNYEYSLEDPEIGSYLSKDKTIGYVYSFAGWKAKTAPYIRRETLSAACWQESRSDRP